MKLLTKIDSSIRKVESGIVAFGIFTSTVIIFWNVILRYVFKDSLTWGEELTRYLMIWLTFVGASLCVRDDVHVNMDILYSRIPLKVRRFLLAVVYGGSVIVTGYLGYMGFSLMQQIRLSGQVSSAMEILPMWIVYLAVPIGCALMAINYAHLFVLNVVKKNPVKNLKGGDLE